MTRTTPRVSFGLYALEIKQDSIPACDDIQPFSKIADLRTDNATARPYATYEDNFWLLDGGYKFLPENTSTVHVGLMSQSMSDNNGNFADPPVLTVTFHQTHDTDGLSLRFSQYTGDYAGLITVAYYDASDALIRSDNYAPTSWEFTTGQAVSAFQKIVITFHTTSRPYRYLRLAGIDYGELIFFTGSDIVSCEIVEQVDPISAELPYCTAEIELYSADGDFSIVNPQGIYAGLKDRQPLAVSVVVDNQTVSVGNFYLQDWKNKGDSNIQFSAVDLVGILDTITYRGGMWHNGTTIETLIESVLGPIFIPYDLDVQLYGTVLRGWLPICTYREALQQIAFAAGAYVTCSRSGSVKIYKTRIAAGEDASTTITRAMKGRDQALALKSLVTGVEVTAHKYVPSEPAEVVYSAELAAGTYEVQFSKPAYDLVATGATLAGDGFNYAIITVATAGAVEISGMPFTDAISTHTATADVPATVKPNVLKIDQATMIGPETGDAVAQRVLDYFSQRYQQDMKLFAPLVEITDVVNIETQRGAVVRALIESMTSDLVNGFTSRVVATGVVHGLE